MNASEAVAIGVTFTWIGLVVGISFIEAPLKFRAPGVTLPIGLGIGRLVFRAVNALEALLAVVLVAALATSYGRSAMTAALGGAVVMLAVQLSLVRPRLTKRSDAVLAGGAVPRSSAHHVFIALEVVKLVALLVGGVLALGAQ